MHLALLNGIISLSEYQNNHTVFSGTFQSHKKLGTMTPVQRTMSKNTHIAKKYDKR